MAERFPPDPVIDRDAPRTGDGAAEAGIRLFVNARPDDAVLLGPILGGLAPLGFVIAAAAPVARMGPQIADLRETPGAHFLVLTIWSRAALTDEDVVARADLAQQAGCLLPVRIEDVDPPIGFRQQQCIDLVSISEASTDPLAQDIRRHLGLAPAPDPAGGQRRRRRGSVIDGIVFVGSFAAFYEILSGAMLGSDLIDRSEIVLCNLIALGLSVVNAAWQGPPDIFLRARGTEIRSELRSRSLTEFLLQGLLIAILAIVWVMDSIYAPSLNYADDRMHLTMIAVAAAGAILLRHLALSAVGAIAGRQRQAGIADG